MMLGNAKGDLVAIIHKDTILAQGRFHNVPALGQEVSIVSDRRKPGKRFVVDDRECIVQISNNREVATGDNVITVAWKLWVVPVDKYVNLENENGYNRYKAQPQSS